MTVKHALLIGFAALVAFAVFSFEWLNYSVAENQPALYPHSDLSEYREALREGAWLVAGLAYALLAAGLAASAVLLRRHLTLAPWLVLVALAALAPALPVVVPALLERVEYGSDPVLSFEVDYTAPISGRPVACFRHGVEPVPDPTVDNRPKLCLQFAAGTKVDFYSLARELNDAGVRPFDDVEQLGLDRLVGSGWTGLPVERVPRSTIRPEPQVRSIPTDAAGTQALIEATFRTLRRCRAREGRYAPCVTPKRLYELRIPQGMGPGEVEVYAVRGSLELSAVSIEEIEFTLTRMPSATARTCYPAGETLCNSAGRW